MRTKNSLKKKILGLMGVAVVLMATLSTAAIAATGDILAQFNGPVAGNGRAIAFDGNNLYYTVTSDLTQLHKITTGGAFVGTIQTIPAVTFGAISWDALNNQFWGGAYDGTGNVYTISPAGVTTFEFTGPFQPGESCYGQSPGHIDGLEYNQYDFPNTLWMSDDAGKIVYHTDTAGNVIDSFPVSLLIGSDTYKCNSGINFDGANLWLNVYKEPNPDVTYLTGQISKVTTAGALVSSFAHDQRLYEDSAYDSVTFASQGKCAIWALQNGLGGTFPAPDITAFEVPCTSIPQKIPEFPTLALPIASIIGLMFLFSRRKRN